MPIFLVEHHNRYRYAAPVDLNYGEARLLPRATPGQRVLASELALSPAADDRRERLDAHGNRVLWFSLTRAHDHLEVLARCRIERLPAPWPETSPAWESVVAALDAAATPDSLHAREFRLESTRAPIMPATTEFAAASFPPGRPLLEAVADLSRRVHAEFRYQPDATGIDTPVADVLRERHGVCQDFAHLCIAGLRGLGLAARYVSGWLETVPPPGTPPRLGADASHAWIAVHLPGHGWFDFDPTNGIAAGDGHLTLAWGRDFDDVTPLKGVVHGGGAHQLDVGVTVIRIDATSTWRPE